MVTEKKQFNSKVTNLLGEGVLLLGILLEHFSIGVDIGLGSILDSKWFGFSTNGIGADIGLILLVCVVFLNPKDDANPLVAGICFFWY